jgi:hypothetical protein
MKRISNLGRNGAMLALAAGLAMSAALSAGEPADTALSAWLGQEITIDSATQSEQVPAGGKLTFVYDSRQDVVRVCTRDVAEQKGAWSKDLASGCKLELKFTRGERYCTLEDVKASDGEVLSSCHRLRGKDVATRSRAGKDSAELRDMLVFLLSPEKGANSIAIVLDAPSRLTSEGTVIIGKN